MASVLVAVPPMGASSVPPQLGVGYLATALRRAGHRVSLLHADRTQMSEAAFVDHVLAARPDVLGLTVVTMAYTAVRRICAALRARGYGGSIVLGGPHATALPELALRETGAAAVITGEGETSTPALVAALAASRRLDMVPGVAFLDPASGRLRRTAPAPLVEDLDALSLPAWDLMDPRRYPAAPHQLFYKRFPTAPIITSRGCRFNCSYCASAVVWGHRYRLRSVDDVVAEARVLARDYGVRELHIVDDDFTAQEDRVLALCDALARADLGLVWSLPNGIRTNTVNDRLASAMARAGCYQAGLGIDVVEQAQMRRVRKLRAPDAAERAVATLQRHGIEVRGFYLLGLDTDTADDLRRTLDVALALPTEFAAFGLATPLPGSPDFARWAEGRDLRGFDWDSLSYFKARDTAHLSAEALQRALREAVLRFYLRPATLARVAARLHLRQAPLVTRGLYRYLQGRDAWRDGELLGSRVKSFLFGSGHSSAG
jgi:radical SAM superfamily enzyme YgiQ (UPF0313 family)